MVSTFRLFSTTTYPGSRVKRGRGKRRERKKMKLENTSAIYVKFRKEVGT